MKKRLIAVLIVIALACLFVVWSAASSGPTHAAMTLVASGDVDLSFDAGAIAHPIDSPSVHAIAVQPDGKTLVGGIFTSVGGTARIFIARVNEDGSVDASFNAPLQTFGNVSGGVQAITLQPDGKILVGGAFFVNGDFSIMVRLNADGSLDSSFSVGVSNQSVSAIAIQPDGKIIIGGDFGLINNVACPNLVRLNADGTIDTQLGAISTIIGAVEVVALQTDGKIVVGGSFFLQSQQSLTNLVRLNADGTIDAGFNIGNGANSSVHTVAVQMDGKIVAGGGFTTVNGATRNGIARVNGDGSVDTGFAPTLFAGSSIFTMIAQPDGKVFITGSFGVINGTVRVRLARLNADGSLDSFYPTGAPSGANNTIWSAARQADNKYLIGGDFTSIAGIARNRLARLLDDAPPPTPTPTATPIATTTALVSSLNPSAAGDFVTFTATVSAATGTPDGNVEFFDGLVSLGNVALPGGTAQLSTSSLVAGTHEITAVYGGSPGFSGSASAPLVQAVGALTPVGINVPVMLKVGGTTIRLIFSEVTQAGQTTAIPTDPCKFGPGDPCTPGDPCRFVLPPGFVRDSSTVAYEINTTATYVIPPDPIIPGSPPIKLSFQSSSFADPSVFSRLGVIHYGPGDPCQPQVLSTVRDFAIKTLTTSTTSLSPFVITPTTDTTTPVTTPALSQSPNANGWHRMDVDVMLAATDEQGGTGVREITYGATGAQTVSETTVAGASTQLTVSAEGTTQITFRATDLAGNVETSQTITIRLDKTAPSVIINTPPNGATYMLNQPVSANYTCADSLSGVASCTGTAASGASLDTASVGGKSFTVSAADLAGNTANQTNLYTVTAPTPSTERIAFVSTRDGNAEVYSMNPDGSGQTRLTFNSAVDANPAFSPDRGRIAFTSLRNGNVEIYLMNADGTNPIRLTNNPAVDDDPAWSPDGNRIVFWSSRDGNAEIYVMNADGTNQTRLTANVLADLQPSFSPDGRQIVFTSNRAAALNFDIYVMNSNGSGVTRLTTHAALDDSPAFSPDGTKIAFTSNRSSALDFEIWVMNASGANLVQLTSAANTSVQPSWSRDGSRIVFASNRSGLLNFEIYSVGASGARPTRLTANAALDLAPSW